MTTFPKHPCPTETPWGQPQHTKELAPGIWHISTMSHGGIWLSPERRAAMPPDMDKITWLGSDEWYEEDCDADWIFHNFWLEFPNATHENARRFLKLRLHQARWLPYPEIYRAALDWPTRDCKPHPGVSAPKGWDKVEGGPTP